VVSAVHVIRQARNSTYMSHSKFNDIMPSIADLDVDVFGSRPRPAEWICRPQFSNLNRGVAWHISNRRMAEKEV